MWEWEKVEGESQSNWHWREMLWQSLKKTIHGKEYYFALSTLFLFMTHFLFSGYSNIRQEL